MAHKDKDKETREERAARRAAEIRAKTAAKEDKTAAKVERDQQRAVLESEGRLKLAAKRREEAKAKRDESKESTLQTIGDFFTGDILGELGGWNKREAEAQTEYEEALKAISGERSRGAAGVASQRGRTSAARDAAAAGRETEIAKHIGDFGRLSEKSKEEALKSIGFTTAQVPKVFRHPDDTLDRFLPEETYTQYTGPKGKVFTMPEKAIRSAIAADRIKIKGEGKKQKKEDAEIYRVQSLANIGASIAAGKKADTYEQTKEREGEQYELSQGRADVQREKMYEWTRGKGDIREYESHLRKTFADSGNAGMPFDEVLSNAKAFHGEGDLPVSEKVLNRYYQTGKARGVATSEAVRMREMSSLGLAGGNPNPTSLPWAYDKDKEPIEKYHTAHRDSLVTHRGGVDAQIALAKRLKDISKTAARTEWDAARDERLGALSADTRLGLDAELGDLGDITELPLTSQPMAVEPFPVDPQTSEGRHHRPALKGWVDGEGGRVLSPEAEDILYRGKDEQLLAKVEDVMRLTGERPPITSAPAINRLHAEALAMADSEAKSLVARSLAPAIHKGTGAWEKSINFVRGEGSKGVAVIAERMLQSQRAAMLLKNAPEGVRISNELWAKALDGHSPPAEQWTDKFGNKLNQTGGADIPTVMIDGVEEPKYAIVVRYDENSDKELIPIVTFANNPNAELSAADIARRDNQVKTKQAQENVFMKNQGVTNLKVLNQNFKIKPNQ